MALELEQIADALEQPENTPIGLRTFWFAGEDRALYHNALGQILLLHGYTVEDLADLTNPAVAIVEVAQVLGISTFHASLIEVADRSRSGYTMLSHEVNADRIKTGIQAMRQPGNTRPLRDALTKPALLLGEHSNQVMTFGASLDRTPGFQWQILDLNLDIIEGMGDLEPYAVDIRRTHESIGFNNPRSDYSRTLPNGRHTAELTVAAQMVKLGHELNLLDPNIQRLGKLAGLAVNEIQLQREIPAERRRFLPLFT